MPAAVIDVVAVTEVGGQSRGLMSYASNTARAGWMMPSVVTPLASDVASATRPSAWVSMRRAPASSSRRKWAVALDPRRPARVRLVTDRAVSTAARALLKDEAIDADNSGVTPPAADASCPNSTARAA